MKRVLIRPSFQDWCGNRLFTQGTSFNSVYQEAFTKWKQVAAKAGFKLDTWDQAPLEQAEVFWFLDLPPSRREFERIRAKLRPGVPMVLQILESPILDIHAFARQNTQNFDAVLSYEHPDVIANQPGYFHYQLPNEPTFPTTNLAYTERKGLLLINSNRVEGFWGMRQVGLAGIPGLGKLLSGWHCSPSMFMEVLNGELYSHRRKIAQIAQQAAPNFLDIYGRGWNGEQISWCPLYPKPKYSCWRGLPKLSKVQLCEKYRFVLSFENFRGNRGYISEKIFDPMFAGAVPVYLGDERITDYIPTDAFVDARNFSNSEELINYLISCSQQEWIKMREAGQEFIRSELSQPFYSENFIASAMNLLNKLITKQCILKT
ncbi:MAG: fucosyl transferase [Moorea sp. SIO3I7]|nr:fucosyl transferase [Moorena sp. SIO3I7]